MRMTANGRGNDGGGGVVTVLIIRLAVHDIVYWCAYYDTNFIAL